MGKFNKEYRTFFVSPVGTADKENQVKMYKKNTVFGIIPI
jgi:hypothetical protein